MRAEDRHTRRAIGPHPHRRCLGIILALLLLGLPGAVEARQFIHGNLSGETVWTEDKAPYLLTGAIELAPDATLHIEPRVTVRFQAEARLLIKGRLVAEKAHFDGREELSNREMIVYHPGSTGYLRHCILENVELNLDTSDVAVTDCLITNRNGSGITVARQAAPFIARNDFHNNSYFAVYKAGRRSLNAPDNYWGAADGPGGVGPGGGDAVNAQVDFRPYATAANGEHVLLKNHRLDRRTCRPGDQLQLEFTLFNFNAFAHDLILGASLQQEGRRPVHSAEDDLKVRVKPGENVFTRPFRLPERMPEGRYHILWGVMKNDLST
ncbi:MAG: right-handed parallel beta-helix repeat-containing protein, partial [Desulfobacterales bacterium]|nr:right-handed parallel beta-helix repeat-containing protein [Desulfobacterales bacterium]